MKNQLLCSSTDESTTDENDEEYWPRSVAANNNCWWRSWGAKFDVKMMKVDPRMRVVRELERLALVATHSHHEGLNELRHKLHMYRSGDFWMPIGGITKENMDIPPLATILLVGFSASGKTSLVNLMYSVLGRSGLVPFAQTSPPETGSYSSNHSSKSRSSMVLKEHNVLRSLRSGFCVFDSRGFEYDQTGEGVEEQVSNWMSDGVRHNQVCLRPGDDAALMEHEEYSASKCVRRRVNCAMVVANMAEIYKALQAGDSKPMEATRQLFCSVNAFTNCNDDERPILILTHGDMLSTEERIEGRLKICESVGVSETSGVYDIVCLTEYGFLAEESDPVSAYAVTEAVYRALLISDRTHSPKKSLEDWALLVLSWIMCFLGSLFALLAQICLKLGRHSKDIY
ncbi:hypothetical protein PRUPE_8G269000 [Prunus persica]|uniref:G domain-containing protein n=1 Tax=Prunus persica TaxID=3760 RepID=A0A251N655_PRUPE|nr:uncharacterized protein LOC18767272 [Prunus persica]ONH94079.1 hypothetical protein PRUPE_8G269000 [Prunus persica]